MTQLPTCADTPVAAPPAPAAARPDAQRRRCVAWLGATAALAGAAGLPGCAAVGAAPALDRPAGRGPVWTPVPLPPPPPLTEGMVDVGDARLWYWDTGGPGVPVVFLHAGSQSGAGWGYQQAAFAATGFRAVGYSRRGHFRSERGPADKPGLACDDLLALVDHLQLGRVHLVALALGAFYALDFALKYPKRLRALSITSSFLGIDDSEADYLAANNRLRPPAFNALPVEVKELHPSYRAGNPAGTAAWVQLAREAAPAPRVSQKRPYPLTFARLASIRHPVLLMTGDGDLYTPPALLRMQAAHLPQAETHVIAQAGHAANWEQPEAFNRRVIDFLRRHPNG